MKKIILAVVLTALVSGAFTACCVQKYNVKQAQLLRYYKAYYEATEEFMNELDEDTGGLVLEAGSDRGDAYWDAKIKLEVFIDNNIK